jgi:hypothetical protein
MSVIAFAAAFLLGLLTLLGLPLTAFLAGLGVSLWLALAHASLAWAATALALGLASEAVASHYAARGKGSLAEAMAFIALGRSLGPWLGSGLFLFSADVASLPAAAGMTALARIVRLLGIALAAAPLAFAGH